MCLLYGFRFRYYLFRFRLQLHFTTWLKQFRYGLAKVLYYMCLFICVHCYLYGYIIPEMS